MTEQTTTPDGLVIVDKPSGFTSHDVVAKMRGIARTRRVGHAGTLDPMATGVLVLSVSSEATNYLGHLALTEEGDLGTIRLGQDTVTDDAEGEITSSTDASGVTREGIDAGVAALTGRIMQVPSKVSAIKIDGKRSYARVRGGEEFEIPARPVTVSSFRVYDVREAVAEDGTPVVDLVVSVVCSSGTYIRALARDLGAGLGVGGHLTALRRTRVGPYGLDAARTLDQHQEELTVMPVADAAASAFPRWDVDEKRAKLLLNGVRLDMPAYPQGPVAVFGPDGAFLVLVEEEKGKAKSLRRLRLSRPARCLRPSRSPHGVCGAGTAPPPGARSTFPPPGPSLLRRDTPIHPIGRALGVNIGGAGGALPPPRYSWRSPAA
ncbi:tRNA pseudouridine synthase B [Streptomyces microflavus]